MAELLWEKEDNWIAQAEDDHGFVSVLPDPDMCGGWQCTVAVEIGDVSLQASTGGFEELQHAKAWAENAMRTLMGLAPHVSRGERTE